GITGTEVSKMLLDSEPRIVLAGANQGGVSIVPYQMSPGDEKVVADRLHAILTKPPKTAPPPAPPEGTPSNIAGQWELKLEFVRGSVSHSLVLEQDGGKLMGTQDR